MMSHPSWVCGLKLSSVGLDAAISGHTLRGCVDWNEIIGKTKYGVWVTPFVGVWIETGGALSQGTEGLVTPFVGVWIETAMLAATLAAALSHPSWVCGLKLWYCEHRRRREWVTPFVGVWIETDISGDVPSPTRSHTLRGCVDWNSILP